MGDNLGIASGLMGRQMSGDSTSIPLQVRAMMAKRKSSETPVAKVDVMADIKAANEGKRNTPVADSTIKMAHDQWVKHLDGLGYEIRKKEQ